jgi:hypothetical protein
MRIVNKIEKTIEQGEKLVDKIDIYKQMTKDLCDTFFVAKISPSSQIPKSNKDLIALRQ